MIAKICRFFLFFDGTLLEVSSSAALSFVGETSAATASFFVPPLLLAVSFDALSVAGPELLVVDPPRGCWCSTRRAAEKLLEVVAMDRLEGANGGA